MKSLTLGLSVAALALAGVACAQSPSGAPDRPRIDANGDGIVTRAEAQAAAAQVFAKLDVNHDGKIDKADRELMHQQMREKLFDKLDTNHDGSISEAEFLADKGPEGRGPHGHGPDGGPGMNGPHGGPDGADDDRDPPPPGEDGPGEDGPGHFGHRGGMHGGMHGRGGPGGMTAMAEQADTNHDGAISQAELIAAAMKRFDAEDTNHDGKVTKEEHQAAREARKAEWQAKKADKAAAN
jgi:Ca2+-binding EF-hand superfamily protein